MRSVVDRNVVMRHILVICSNDVTSTENRDILFMPLCVQTKTPPASIVNLYFTDIRIYIVCVMLL
jgi:hypothetical protein